MPDTAVLEPEQQTDQQPDESRDALRQKYDELQREAGDETTEIPEAGEEPVSDEGEVEAAPEKPSQPEHLSEYQKDQARAKEFGISPKLKHEELKSKIAEAEQRREQLRTAAKQRGFTEADFERLDDAALERSIVALDRQRAAAQQAQQRQQWEAQQAGQPQDQYVEEPPAINWEEITENYGEDDPLVRTAKALEQRLNASEQQQQQLTQYLQQQHQQQLQQQEREYEDAFLREADAFAETVGIDLGQGNFQSRAPDQQLAARQFYQHVRQMHEQLPGYSLQQVISYVGREMFANDIQHNTAQSQSRQRLKKQVMGDPSSKRQKPAARQDADTPLRDNPRLKEKYNELIAENGSEDFVR